MRNLTFVYDEKTQEYRCDKNGEIFTYIYKRYEPNNPRKRRYCYMVKVKWNQPKKYHFHPDHFGFQ